MGLLTRLMSILIAVVFVATCETVALAETQPNDTIVSRIPREPVGSTAIASVGYSKRKQILELEFVNGAIYRYFEVPRSTYHGFMDADSKSHYFHQNIKGKFRSLRIRRWHKENAEE